MAGRVPLSKQFEVARERAVRPFARLARMHRYVTAGGAFVALVMLSLCVMALYEGRAEALQHARETSQNLLQILEKDIARNVELYDLSLSWMLESSQRPDVMALPTNLQREILFDRSAHAKYLGAMLVIDAKGHIAVDSVSETPRPGVYSDRDYFLVQRDNPHAGLYVSRPFQSRLRKGEWTVALTRRIDKPDGTFGGIALVAISLAYFRDLLGGLDIGPHGVLLLMRDDGTVIVRQPYHPEDIGRSMLDMPGYPRIASDEAGTFVSTGSIDGIRRLYSFKRIPGLPVVAVVAPAEDDILESWRQRTLLISVLMVLFSAAFIAVSMLLARELRQRAKAQSLLIEQATHDKLTGINNRHALDAALASAWRRAQRDRTPFGALFIDIDAFKAYNDLYGHSAGDVALSEVAKAITACVKRPSDIVGRYGGEEFVVGLPDTSLDGAVQVANAIRERVQRMGLPHAQHTFGVVTVSVGVAASVADELGRREVASAPDLLRLADAALYVAKREGRNAVRTSAAAQAATEVTGVA
ncbi:diguanylate cyclase [Pararobbsia alpina]|uniref:sensor domain-containing diguanylate cyclase n=1 Tax=Pararobbsia alpina TaxID=621374 RepID=UPI0039A41C5F